MENPPFLVGTIGERLFEVAYKLFVDDVRNAVGRSSGPSMYDGRRMIRSRGPERPALTLGRFLATYRRSLQTPTRSAAASSATTAVEPMWFRDP